MPVLGAAEGARQPELVAIMNAHSNAEANVFEPDCTAAAGLAIKLNGQILKWIKQSMDVDIDD